MSMLVELLVHHYIEWPEHDGEPISTIVQSPRGTLWLNRPKPNYDPTWRTNEWASDFVSEACLDDVADDHQMAIVTKDMWLKAKAWANAPLDATHRSDKISGKYRAGFYKLDSGGVWMVWAPVSQTWIPSDRCRKESDHSFLIPRDAPFTAEAQAQAPENDIDNW